MSGYSRIEVQKAILAAIVANAGMTALIGDRMWDDTPQDETFPYGNFGDHTALPFDTKTDEGEELSLYLHFWSRYPGRKEILDIMKASYDLLHNGSLIVVGLQVILIQRDYEEDRLDPDGKTWHGVQRFRILTTEA